MSITVRHLRATMRHTRPTLDLTRGLTAVITDICTRLPEFAHVDPHRLLVCLSRARRNSATGSYAKIVPMRFAGGLPYRTVGDHRYVLPQIPTPDGDVLYLIYVTIPRFFEQTYERRALALIHELYHIAQAFDGTIRRVGRGAHGASRAGYNAALEPLVATYLKAELPAEVLEVLRWDLKALAKTMTLVGRMLPLPKAIRLE
jgi:hypothetical protein